MSSGFGKFNLKKFEPFRVCVLIHAVASYVFRHGGGGGSSASVADVLRQFRQFGGVTLGTLRDGREAESQRKIHVG